MGYRVEAGVLLVSGDPVGPPAALPGLLRELCGFVEARGLAIGVLGASEEFVNRPDALPAFEKAYGFKLSQDQLLTLAGGNTATTMKAAAEQTDGVNAAMTYGTDGQLAALGLTAALGIAFMFLGDIYVIAAVSNFGILFSYLITGFALVKIRRMRSHPEKHKDALEAARVSRAGVFDMPLFPYLPALGILILIAFLFAFPSIALSIGVGLILTSLIVYYALREDRDEPVIRIRFFR